MSTSQDIKISDLCLVNIPLSQRKKPKFRIIIQYGRMTAKSGAKKSDLDKNSVAWEEPFVFAGVVTHNNALTLTAFWIHSVFCNKLIGSSTVRLDLDNKTNMGLYTLKIAGDCHLTCKIEVLSNAVSEVVGEALGASQNIPRLEAPTEAIELVSSAAELYEAHEEMWTSFLSRFQVFMKVMDDFSEISPYAKIAWNILSVIPKVIITQVHRDIKARRLCRTLKETYDYVTDAKRIRELTVTQSKTLSVLVQQTIECAYFIRTYSMEGTVKNIIKGVSVDAKIRAFNDKFDHLKKVMTESVILETSVVTLRVSDKINELNDLTLLGEMPYDPDAGFTPGKQCLPGTRQTLINEILEWINNDASPQILVLSGQAGSGKSAVAHTIAGIFQKQNRLGSMFCFNRSYKDRRNCLFSTISRDLADSDALWRQELVSVIETSAIRKKKDAETQFNELIVKPSKNVATIGSVVIVVDSLDESGDRSERKEILDLLLDRCTELPKNYRIIVTTRPEEDIELQCQNSKVLCKRMEDIDAKETCLDIQAYVSSCLAPISSILDKIEEAWCRILAQRAEGLFQWAQTVCKFIDPTVTRSKLVEKKWKTCISASSSSLYGLYRQIISSQSESQDADFVEDFKMIVSAIITARESLSISALQNIFDNVEDIKSILSPFSSLFAGVHDSSTPVRPLHTSLFDFFTCKKTNEYYIDTSDQSLMTLACLKLMNRTLCFNICRLETSHLRNWEVPDFSSRVEKAIPSHLSYSCRFWAFHLRSSPHSDELIREIRGLMNDNLLYFFEVLSLLTAVDQGCVAMREIVNWCNDADGDLAADAMDAWKFGYEFRDAMIESTPHLYLSALPFTPLNSFVSKNYLGRYPGLFGFDIGQPVSSSRKIGITQKHEIGGPKSLTFSPEGRYIATGSTEGEFWVWNYLTGERMVREVRPTIGKDPDHKWAVSDIVYSCNGELAYCCFCDGDILVWDTKTNETSIEKYGDIVGAECDLCTISADGCFITWSTEKGRLLFDRENRRIVDQFNGDGCLICEAVFSPNGDWLAFYWNSQTEVYIWNTQKQVQNVISRDAVGSLALTNDYIAFKKTNTSIEIRDVRANTYVAEIQHDAYVTSFQFSPNNQYILSSFHNVFSIWSVSTGELIGRSYVDNIIHCLAFSHDSESVALGTSDGTINVRQWNKSVKVNDSRGVENGSISAIWLRGTYLILQYVTSLGRGCLQISDTTTTNTVVHEVELGLPGPVRVFPDEENVGVAYVSSRGLCFWNGNEGEVVVDESGQSITALGCSDKYLISADVKGTIKIWDSYTRKSTGGPIAVSQWVRTLLIATTGTCFAVVYGNYMEVRNCESGSIVGGPFTSGTSSFRPVAFAANETHVICMSQNSVDILDVSTGTRVNSISFSCDNPDWRLSPNGKYLSWMDNGEMKLLDTDTEALLEGPSQNQSVKKLWFSNDSTLAITVSSANTSENIGILDLWNIQSGKTIIKPIQYPFKPKDMNTLALSNGRLADSIERSSRCSLWDLNLYEMMSALYDPSGDKPCTPTFDKTDMLDYALTAWRKASLTAFAKMNNGWVLGLRGELLFWVPEKRRAGFWYPCMMHVPCKSVTKLNFESFVHGASWTECKTKPDRD